MARQAAIKEEQERLAAEQLAKKKLNPLLQRRLRQSKAKASSWAAKASG